MARHFSTQMVALYALVWGMMVSHLSWSQGLANINSHGLSQVVYSVCTISRDVLTYVGHYWGPRSQASLYVQHVRIVGNFHCENYRGLLAGTAKRCHTPKFYGENLEFCKSYLPIERFPLYSTSLSCVVTAYVSLVLSPSLPHTSLFAGTVREKELGAGKAWKWWYHHKQVLWCGTLPKFWGELLAHSLRNWETKSRMKWFEAWVKLVSDTILALFPGPCNTASDRKLGRGVAPKLLTLVLYM